MVPGPVPGGSPVWVWVGPGSCAGSSGLGFTRHDVMPVLNGQFVDDSNLLPFPRTLKSNRPLRAAYVFV